MRDDLIGSLSARTAIALLGGGVAAIAFIKVAEDVQGEETGGFDQAVSLWVQGFDSPATRIAMESFSFIGSAPMIIGVVAVVAAWAFRRGARSLAGVLVAVASVAEGLNLLLKLLFHRARPALFKGVVAPDSYSFPSGHAMVSAAVFGLIAIVIARLHPGLKRPLFISMPVLVLFIGVSRVFLGVHWPSDVLAGFAAGGMVLVAGSLAVQFAYPSHDKKSNRT